MVGVDWPAHQVNPVLLFALYFHGNNVTQTLVSDGKLISIQSHGLDRWLWLLHLENLFQLFIGTQLSRSEV